MSGSQVELVLATIKWVESGFTPNAFQFSPLLPCKTLANDVPERQFPQDIRSHKNLKRKKDPGGNQWCGKHPQIWPHRNKYNTRNLKLQRWAPLQDCDLSYYQKTNQRSFSLQPYSTVSPEPMRLLKLKGSLVPPLLLWFVIAKVWLLLTRLKHHSVGGKGHNIFVVENIHTKHGDYISLTHVLVNIDELWDCKAQNN